MFIGFHTYVLDKHAEALWLSYWLSFDPPSSKESCSFFFINEAEQHEAWHAGQTYGRSIVPKWSNRAVIEIQ